MLITVDVLSSPTHEDDFRDAVPCSLTKTDRHFSGAGGFKHLKRLQVSTRLHGTSSQKTVTSKFQGGKKNEIGMLIFCGSQQMKSNYVFIEIMNVLLVAGQTCETARCQLLTTETHRLVASCLQLSAGPAVGRFRL